LYATALLLVVCAAAPPPPPAPPVAPFAVPVAVPTKVVTAALPLPVIGALAVFMDPVYPLTITLGIPVMLPPVCVATAPSPVAPGAGVGVSVLSVNVSAVPVEETTTMVFPASSVVTDSVVAGPLGEEGGSVVTPPTVGSAVPESVSVVLGNGSSTAPGDGAALGTALASASGVLGSV
jgi:hypothetical protein